MGGGGVEGVTHRADLGNRWRRRAFPLGGVVLVGQRSRLQVGPLGVELKRVGQVHAGRWRRRSFQRRDVFLGMKNSPLVLPTPSLVPQVKLQPERGAQEDPAPPPSSQAPSRPQAGRELPTQSQRPPPQSWRLSLFRHS